MNVQSKLIPPIVTVNNLTQKFSWNDDYVVTLFRISISSYFNLPVFKSESCILLWCNSAVLLKSYFMFKMFVLILAFMFYLV